MWKRRWQRRAALMTALLLPLASIAAELSVTVLDRKGHPVPDVVVYASDAQDAAIDDPAPPAVMDQVDRRFDPHILVVSTGASVRFPNSDIVAHHVYSFSRPNHFTLPLYKGTPLEPVRFEHAGLVTIGCNIHDDMLAYIMVVDTPVFAKTDAAGQATLTADRWQYPTTLTLWSPRFRGNKGLLTRTITSGDAVEVRVEKALRPAHRQRAWSNDDEDY